MHGWSPPSLSNRTVALVGTLLFATLLYALLVAQNVLLGLLPLFAVGGGYLAWRLLLAFEAIADALQRLAAAREGQSEE